MTVIDMQESLMNVLASGLGVTDGVEVVVKRSMNSIDVNGTLAIALDYWKPLEYEMSGNGSLEPSICEYTFTVQHMVKWGEHEAGEKLHREVAKAVRLMLYRDPTFQVSLRSLVAQDDTRKERVIRFHVVDQRYASNDIKGAYVFLSSTELVIETEVVSLT